MEFFFNLTISLLMAAAVLRKTHADSTVTGTVFCDICKDGRLSHFDYPLYGAVVAVTCPNGDGEISIWKEERTNWFGTYIMIFDDNQDLSECYAEVVNSPIGCPTTTVTVNRLKLLFNLFGEAMYAVDPLLSQPLHPIMPFCPISAPPPLQTADPPAAAPPAFFLRFNIPVALPSKNWTMVESICEWKGATPYTKVVVAFGLLAGEKYGFDITLWEGLQEEGDMYRTLLREAIAALLNSYHAIDFMYSTFVVISEMNLALLGSPKQTLATAMRFRKANSDHALCWLNPCKA